MLELDVFADLPLRGGLRLKEVRRASAPLVDAIGRPAVARTFIIGNVLEVELQRDLSDEETSVSLYHEVIEGATLAVLRPPAATIDLNEAGFETAARQAYSTFGLATPAALNAMLASFGF